MRKLTDLGLYILRGPIVTSFPPVHDETLRGFEAHFDVTLPSAYVSLLKTANGTAARLRAFHKSLEDIEQDDNTGDFEPIAEDIYDEVSEFFPLTEDRHFQYGVWHTTERIRSTLGIPCVAFAENGGSDPLFLDMRSDPPCVRMFYHDPSGIPKLANSFEEFIDMLTEPEMDEGDEEDYPESEEQPMSRQPESQVAADDADTSSGLVMTNEEFEQFVMLVVRDIPVRYYRDGRQNGSFSHHALEMYVKTTQNAKSFIEELNERGLTYLGKKLDGGYVIHKWEIRREPSRRLEP